MSREIIEAHKYLYYVLNTPVISDYEYDRMCEQHGIFGGGGSDYEADYSEETKELAGKLWRGEQ